MELGRNKPKEENRARERTLNNADIEGQRGQQWKLRKKVPKNEEENPNTFLLEARGVRIEEQSYYPVS